MNHDEIEEIKFGLKRIFIADMIKSVKKITFGLNFLAFIWMIFLAMIPVGGRPYNFYAIVDKYLIIFFCLFLIYLSLSLAEWLIKKYSDYQLKKYFDGYQ